MFRQEGRNISETRLLGYSLACPIANSIATPLSQPVRFVHSTKTTLLDCFEGETARRTIVLTRKPIRLT